MDLKAGLPYSLIKHGIPIDYPKLLESTQADVVIIGGGISGALTAHQLTKEGLDCVVVDGRSIGLGSTCASTSILQYEIDVPLCQLIDKVGEAHGARAYHLCLDSIRKLDDIANEIGFRDFKKCRSIFYAAKGQDKNFLEKEFAARKKHQLPAEFFTQREVKNAFDISSSCAIVSSVAAKTDAYLFTHHLHQFNIRKGLRVFDRTYIEKIVNRKGSMELRTAEGHFVRAKFVVNATGYEVTNFIKKKIVNLLATYATISETMNIDGWNEDAVFWNTANPYLYFRSTPDHRIMIGGRDEKFYNPKKRDRVIGRKSKQLWSDFKKLFPSMEVKPEFNWTGTFGSTVDGLPFIGQSDPKSNTYYALGFGGNGITFSAVGAEIIGDLLMGRPNSDAKIFSFTRV